MAEEAVSILQPPQPVGIIDKVSGFILPLADRFIEFEEIRKSTGRELNAVPVTGIVDDPNPEQVFTPANVANQRQQAASQILNVVPILVVAGLVIVGGVIVARAIK